MWEIVKIVSPYLLALFSLIISLVAYMGRQIHDRIKNIENKQCEFTTSENVRQLVEDKIEPIEKRIDKIDEKLDKIIELLIRR